MPLDPHECHEYAKRCMELAAETTDPNAQEILLSTAQLGASRLQIGRRPRRIAGAAPQVNFSVAGTNASAAEPSLVRGFFFIDRYRRFDARLRLAHDHALSPELNMRAPNSKSRRVAAASASAPITRPSPKAPFWVY